MILHDVRSITKTIVGSELWRILVRLKRQRPKVFAAQASVFAEMRNVRCTAFALHGLLQGDVGSKEIVGLQGRRLIRDNVRWTCAS